ncbi:MAG TPA: TraR/DksA family transcriptional regulator [Candidatus Eisenbacteria bacterium]|nr:TraR/DksA family transcriptional regulator [Candidatus Eisenbacteria bacterium]
MEHHLLSQFKSGLQEQQRDLLHAIQRVEKEIPEFAGLVPLDETDRSCLTALKESLFACASQHRGRLRLIQRALERIKDGSFGICAECEGTIGLKRLQAVPWASHCIECQQRAEVARLASNSAQFMSLPDSAQASGS